MLNCSNVNMLKCSKGFTLIETLITVSIVGIGFIGFLFAFNQFSKLDKVLNDKATAIYLSQEGAEIVRNIRDTNRLRGDLVWDSGISNGTFIPVLNSPLWELNNIGGGEEWKNRIYFDPGNSDGDSFTGYRQSQFQNPPQLPDTWEKKNFYREVEIDKNDPDNDSNTEDIQIKVKVWYGDSAPVIIESYLYNWR